MQYAHNKYDVTRFHGALLDVIGVMNHPQQDDILLSAAGVQLDQSLFPLLVTIGRYGPIGVVSLADRLGRDYTTVSRQVKRLQARGLVDKQAAARDRRISEVMLSAEGVALRQSIDAARQTLMNAIFADWDEKEVAVFFQLMEKYAACVQR